METHVDAPDIRLGRIPKAFGFAWSGLCTAWRTEAAFRQEAIVSVVLLPVACLAGMPMMHRLLLVLSLLFVLLVELLNCAVESTIDRISLERHELSKRAKDAGSAAVLVAIAMAVLVWAVVLGLWFFAPAAA
jgi:diacylglycerol kinase (ATP)